MSARVVILMGSKSDLPHVQQIADELKAWEIPYTMHVASAHKSASYVLELVARYERMPVVYIAVAGRSNALAGMLDANTASPVITCPPISSTFSGADIYSSLRMPSGVAPTVVLEPRNAALAAIKMLALSEPALRQRIREHQRKLCDEIIAADHELQATFEHTHKNQATHG